MTFFKTAATALVLALATATVADAATAPRAGTTHTVAGKTIAAKGVAAKGVAAKGMTSKSVTGKAAAGKGVVRMGAHKGRSSISLIQRHRAHLARRMAKHGTFAHRVLAVKVARAPGVRQVAANHRAGAKTSVIR